MSAPHFFAADVAGERVTLSDEEARHAVRVLRVREGETITVSDGRGTVVEAIVETTGDELVAVIGRRRSEPRARPALVVFHGIPKAGKLDGVVQKLTEIGVDTITPFPAIRSVSRWDARKASDQTRRLGAIAREAAKQSRRAWLPEVTAPAAPAEIDLPEPTLILHEEAEVRMRDLLPQETPERMGLIVGPEGGLTEEEVGDLERRGARSASLGPTILRTETAALAAAVFLLGRYGRFG